MKKNKDVIIISLFFILFLPFFFGEKKESPEPTQQEPKRETLSLSLADLSYDKENSEIKANIESNLPKGTIVKEISLTNPNELQLAKDAAFTIDKDLTTVTLVISENDQTSIIDGEYSLELTIEVDENNNSSFLENKVIGGKPAVMKKQYKDSSLINVIVISNSDMSYLVSMKSNKHKLKLPVKLEEETTSKETVEESKEENTAIPEEAYKFVTANELKQNFYDLMTTDIEVKGKVTQVIENDENAIDENSKSFLVNISEPNQYNADNSVWVEVVEESSTIIEGSTVTVKGTLVDTYTYPSVSGTDVTVPYIIASSIVNSN